MIVSVAIGDLNADEKPDLVVAHEVVWFGGVYGWVSALLGDGDGGFQTIAVFSIVGSPVSVAIGDLNGDGKPALDAGLDVATMEGHAPCRITSYNVCYTKLLRERGSRRRQRRSSR